MPMAVTPKLTGLLPSNSISIWSTLHPSVRVYSLPMRPQNVR